MDAADSSSEEVIVKTRKPYTITKQRERWTEEEHNRFLEALKLHGRAWQRIEEHIGTKSAVQIRSHAQKFFTKLEKEALVKGVPIGQAIDIDIPPPRPKRKPSNPYPRKSSAVTATLQSGEKDVKLNSVESSHVESSHVKLTLDLEKEPLPEKHNVDEGPTTVKENKDGDHLEVFTVGPDVPYSSVSSANKSSVSTSVPWGSSGALKEITPSLKEVIALDGTNESFITIELGNRKLATNDGKQTNGCSKDSKLEDSEASQVKLVQSEKTDGLNCAFTIDGMQSNQNYPRHVTVQVFDGNVSTNTQNPSQDMRLRDSIFQPIGEVNGQPKVFTNSAASNTGESQSNTGQSSIHQSFLPYPPFTQHNQDDYQSFIHMSSTFSSLVVSNLLQNPAAHAAASFAATYWPHARPETLADSSRCSEGGFPCRQMGSPPSMAAIVAATVAAATAWWATHGLLPMCAPPHTAFAFPPASVTAVPSVNTDEGPASEIEQGNTYIQNPPQQGQILDPEHSEAQQTQHSALKSPTITSSDSENGDAKLHTLLKATDHEMKEVSQHLDSNITKGKTLVDRSSCGSNTSSSDLETDALEKDEKGKEELETLGANLLAAEFINRRYRTVSNLTDSWKEVSEEGRVAFRALFSRQVLPQSFSPPQNLKNKDHQLDNIMDDKLNTDDKDKDDVDRQKCSSSYEGMQKNLPFFEINEEGQVTIGLEQGKLNTRRTGFKPYKRCSMEAKENRVGTTSNQGDEKGCKRIRLEREAST